MENKIRNKKIQLTKEEIAAFIKWTFKPENRLFIKNASGQKIADCYKEQTGIKITPAFVLYNKNKWILIGGEPYEKDKIPLDILKKENIKKALEQENVEIVEL